MERSGYTSGHKKHHHRREENFNQQNLMSALFGSLNINSVANLINNIDVNELINSINDNSILSGEGNDNSEIALRKNEIAGALKTLINCDKAELIQVLLKFYALRKPVKK